MPFSQTRQGGKRSPGAGLRQQRSGTQQANEGLTVLNFTILCLCQCLAVVQPVNLDNFVGVLVSRDRGQRAGQIKVDAFVTETRRAEKTAQ